MKKNGFTIVELMASIIILAIITTLGVCCVNIVSTRIIKSNYESKKSLIEIKAAEYASDTGFLFTNVDNLVKLGYISADDKNDNVINPINQEPMNCLIVKIVNDDDNLYATLTEEKECDNDAILQTNMHLGINIFKESDNSKVENDTWVNENVLLEVYFKDLDINEDDVEKIIWKTNAFTNEKDVMNVSDFRAKNKFLIEASQIVNTTYYVEVVLKDKTVYYAKVIVKIDKQNPIVYEDEIKVTLEDALISRDNKLKVVVSDNNGSGISGYYIGDNPDCHSASYTSLSSDTTSFEVPVLNSIYYICLKDNVGNYSENVSAKIVDLVHFEAPTINNIADTLVLGSEDYDFKTNVEVDFGIFEGQVSCNPTISRKSGDYDVTCTAVSANGLASSTMFHVHHT